MKKILKEDVKNHIRDNYYHDFKESIVAEEYEHYLPEDLGRMIENDTDSLCYFLKHKGIIIED